jgi:predicted negative regulator of RcsB-dependent stress response
VQGYTRRQLKQDRFVETTQEAVHWASGHQRFVVWGVVAVVVAAGGYFGLTAWLNHQNELANAGLTTAVRTLSEPLRPADAPANVGGGFSSVTERAKAAEKQFQDVAQKYSYTQAGKIARYMQGVSAVQAGDSAAAEQQFKSAAESRDKDVAALAKMALASLYRSQNRQTDAIRIYKDVEAHPTDTVSKTQAELELAALYEKTDPAQATAIYKQIQTEEPTGPAAQIASARLATLK